MRNFEEDQKWKNEFKKWEIKDASWKRKVEQDTSKIGFLYEDLVRRVKSKGSDFARKFKLRNLSGLTRLAYQKISALINPCPQQQ